MARRSHRLNGDSHPQDDIDLLLEPLIEAIWQDLNGQIPYERICQVAYEVAAAFQDAVVTTFVPILIHRQTRDKLKAEINGKK